jgi:hypothetical protein
LFHTFFVDLKSLLVSLFGSLGKKNVTLLVLGSIIVGVRKAIDFLILFRAGLSGHLNIEVLINALDVRNSPESDPNLLLRLGL